MGGGAGGTHSGKMGGPLFGRSLHAGCLWGGVRHATPVVIQRAVHYLNSHANALRSEGLFRLAGEHSVLQSVQQQFDAGVDVDLAVSCKDDVYTVAALLLKYMGGVSPSAVPMALSEHFVAAKQIAHPEHRKLYVARLAHSHACCRRSYLRALIATLPAEHQRSLDLLCSFLHDVAKNASTTKMTVDNLATVFGPCLIALVSNVYTSWV